MCGKLFCTRPKNKTNELQYNVRCGEDEERYSSLYTKPDEEHLAPGLVKDFTSCGENKVILLPLCCTTYQ